MSGMNGDGMRKAEIRNRRTAEERKQRVFERYESGLLDLGSIDIYDLIGCPIPVLTHINKLTRNAFNMESGPPIMIDNNRHLTSLEGIPAITYRVNADFCSLTSLEHAPMIVKGSFSAVGNPIRSLEGIGKRYLKECVEMNFAGVILFSNTLGLMNVKGLREVHFSELVKELQLLEEITNSHLQGDHDLLEYQEDLVKAGLKHFAKL